MCGILDLTKLKIDSPTEKKVMNPLNILIALQEIGIFVPDNCVTLEEILEFLGTSTTNPIGDNGTIR